MKSRLITCASLTTLFAVALPVLAHHSQSEFSQDFPLDLQGTVTKLEWKSPHARLYLDVVDENGVTVNWNFELPSPNTMMRRGWTRKSLEPGQQVAVTGVRARNYPDIALARSIRDEEGNPLFTGATPVYEIEPEETD